MIDQAADDEVFLKDWEEALELYPRDGSEKVDFMGAFDEVPSTDPDVTLCAITARTASIPNVKKEDVVKRVKDGKQFAITDPDTEGNLIYLRGQNRLRDFLGGH